MGGGGGGGGGLFAGGRKLTPFPALTRLEFCGGGLETLLPICSFLLHELYELNIFNIN